MELIAYKGITVLQTVSAIIDSSGKVTLLEPIEIPGACRALVTILGNETSDEKNETALLSEAALAADWNRPEEDAAWAHLQSAK
jgi:hypothetical protein